MATNRPSNKFAPPAFLHIATHGFFLADPKRASPENSSENRRGVDADFDVKSALLRSGLALAEANLTQTGPEKGILAALEASNLNLWGTDLVTVSACDTGAGELRNGGVCVRATPGVRFGGDRVDRDEPVAGEL
jgi:CHAT domain-containing protein